MMFAEIIEWMHLIEIYTKRRATKIEDKLPAIAGVAATWPPPLRPIYLAGLWSFSIAVQLMWKVTLRPYRLFEPEPERRAPRWSWASLDGEIKHFTWGQAQLKNTSVYGTTIVGGHTTPRYANVPFGDVISGVLQMQTPMCRRWHEPTDSKFGGGLMGSSATM
jgi:hypothetical protein